MMSSTEDLIEDLSADAGPVKPLGSPVKRTATWLGLSLPYMAFIVWLAGLSPDLAWQIHDINFLLEQSASLLAALAAAFAAFCAVVPGRARWVLLLPLVPIGIWLTTLGAECFADWRVNGDAAFAFVAHWNCVPSIVLIGALPVTLLAIMLRRGAPLYPHLAVALGGLAAGALGNFGLNLFHAPDAGLMVLIWHFGTVALMAGLAGLLGEKLHHWRTA
jgi:hypothetical protein